MKTNRKAVANRNSNKSQKGKSRNPKTMPELPGIEHKQVQEKINALAKFPDENPFPVMRLNDEGIILYANKASRALLEEWKTTVGQPAPEFWHKIVTKTLENRSQQMIEISMGARVLSLVIAPVFGERYVNLYGSDITERKQAEKVVAEERNLLLTLINNLPDRIYVKDIQGRKVISNIADWQSSSGKRMEDVLGKTDFDTYPAELAAQFWTDDKMVLDSGKPVINREEPGLDTQGNHIWSLSTKVPWRDDNGQIVGLVGIGRDITERKQAEARIAASEAELRALFAAMTDVVIVYDADGRYVKIAPTSPINLYHSPGEMLGKTVHDTLPKEQADYIVENIREALRTGQMVNCEYALQIAGKEIWFASNATRLAENTVIWVAHDITERKQTEVVLQQSEKKFADAFKTSPDAITISRLSDGVYLEINQAFTDITGFTREDVIGRSSLPGSLQIWVNKEDRDRMMTGVKATGEVIGIEALFRMKNGQSKNGLMSARIMEVNGEACILSTTRDISERKQAEEKIQQHLQRLSTLRNIDLAISSNFDLNVTFNILLGYVIAQLGVDAAAVLLFRQSMNEFEFAAGQGFRTSNIKRLRLKLGEDYLGRAALERRTIAVPNLAKGQEDFGDRFIEGEGFATFFAVPLIAKGKVKGMLEVFHRSPFYADADWLSFLEALAGQTAIAIDNSELFGDLQQTNLELQSAYDKTIEGWSRALDLRDKETEGHTQRVTKTTLRLASAMGLGEAELIQVRRGALLHDIGKMGVPDYILLKPEVLNEEEWVMIKKHPQFAFDLLSPIDFLRLALDIPYYHHEKWDGTGYPRGLKGEQIPLTARIFAIVDAYDALTSNRPYRLALSKEKALESLKSEAGTYFDPNIVSQFVEVIRKD